MLSEQEQQRYSKQIILPEIGIGGQELLRNARVLVAGAGGLGCPVLQYLAAAGVGTLGIADGDEVDISNLQRQVLYTTADVGKSKAQTAADKLKELNPNVDIEVFNEFIDTANVLKIIADFDIVVDGTDNFATRYLLNDACVMAGKPMVSGAIFRFEGQVSVFNYKGGPTYRCLFPEPPGAGESPNCAEIGVAAALPGIVGSIQAMEVMKIITQAGDVLSGRLLVMDTLSMNSHVFSFALQPHNLKISTLPSLQMNACAVPTTLLTYAEWQQLTNQPHVQVVDVREPYEHEEYHIGGINVPLSTLLEQLSVIDPLCPVALYCARGSRSKTAATLLRQHGYKMIYELKGGINAAPMIKS